MTGLLGDRLEGIQSKGTARHAPTLKTRTKAVINKRRLRSKFYGHLLPETANNTSDSGLSNCRVSFSFSLSFSSTVPADSLFCVLTKHTVCLDFVI